MKICIPKETNFGESRVALNPDAAKRLIQAGHEVFVQAGAGVLSHFTDEAYVEAGATSLASLGDVWSKADVVVKVAPPTEQDKALYREGLVYVGFLNPLAVPENVQGLADKKVTAFSMEMIPRISRAQSMDALSSQASIGGYKAVLLAAQTLGKYFPMLTTAAGTIPPAKVLIIGVGVAGLQAIATARRLGAVVEAYDIRPEVKEQVQSLGAKFVEVELEESGSGEGGYAKEVSEDTKKKLQDALANRVAASDIVITTAQVPGKKAPVLISGDMVKSMRPGAVIVDMASEQGGNVVGSKPGEVVEVNGVKVLGPVNLPAQMPEHASQLYAKNVLNLLNILAPDGKLNLNFEDDIIKGACVSHEGQITNERIKQALGK